LDALGRSFQGGLPGRGASQQRRYPKVAEVIRIYYFRNSLGLSFHVDTRNAAMVPAKFTASSAWRALGLTCLRPWPCASPDRFRIAARLLTTAWQFPRIALKMVS